MYPLCTRQFFIDGDINGTLRVSIQPDTTAPFQNVLPDADQVSTLLTNWVMLLEMILEAEP